MGEWWNAFVARAEARAPKTPRAFKSSSAGLTRPTIEVAAKAGACFGVERALRLLQKTLDTSAGPVATLGPLIHNPQVVRDLEEKGVKPVDAVSSAQEGTLVLRTHGVPPEVPREACAAGLTVVDATCPNVKKAQKTAERLSAQGRHVILVGEAGHPEVEGILAHAPGAFVIRTVEEAKTVEIEGPIGLLAQTTQDPRVVSEVARALRERGFDVAFEDTICLATKERQDAAVELASRAQVMVVIGGRNSANTTRLVALCQSHAKTHHIESAAELEASWFRGTQLIGVTAGASTPKAQIEDVVRATQKLLDALEDTSSSSTL